MTNTSINDGQARIVSGLLTGLISTIIFNPLDKALYLFSAKNAPLFSLHTWRNPYQGMQHAVVNRTISYGLYYSILDFYTDKFKNASNPVVFQVMPGVMTGINTAIVTNPINLLKHYSWNSGLRVIPIMKIIGNNEGFLKGFTRGLGMTIIRDIVFAIPYSISYRYAKNRISDPFTLIMTNICVGCFSTVLCSPINYLRSMKFAATCYKTNPKVSSITRDLIHCVNKIDTVKGKLSYVSRALCLGPGTLRVGLGISFGQYMYERFLILLK